MASRVQRMADRNQTVNIWTAKIIPIVLAGVVGYATYVLVALLCGKYAGIPITMRELY
jgi:palmitoyltransferase